MFDFGLSTDFYALYMQYMKIHIQDYFYNFFRFIIRLSSFHTFVNHVFFEVVILLLSKTKDMGCNFLFVLGP